VLVVSVLMLLYPVLWVGGIIGIIVSAILIVLVGVGWRNLQ
jgi:hypothetical protein